MGRDVSPRLSETRVAGYSYIIHNSQLSRSNTLWSDVRIHTIKLLESMWVKYLDVLDFLSAQPDAL